MKITINNYRVIEAAEIELNPIALVSGMNEQGKSCIAQAARAVLSGEDMPVKGLNKKDSSLLVREGAESGSAKLDCGDGHEAREIRWPIKNSKSYVGLVPVSSGFSSGLKHLLDLDDKERAKALERYLNSTPDQHEFVKALNAIQIKEDDALKVWNSVGKEGWDSAHKKVREQIARLKGQWEGITRERYGSTKAQAWAPKDWSDDLSNENEKALDVIVGDKESQLEAVIRASAASDSNIEALKMEASRIDDLYMELGMAEEAKKRAYQKWTDLRILKSPEILKPPMLCPECGTALSAGKDGLIKAEIAPTSEQIEASKKAAKKHQDDTMAAEQAYRQAEKELTEIQTAVNSAGEAIEKLAEIQESQTSESATEAEVESARQELDLAKRRLAAFMAKLNADKLHSGIVKNEKLADILAPDGLRKSKMAEGLKLFNAQLRKTSMNAGWQEVWLDEDFQCRYGAYPVWAASASGQWRARAVIQVAMAKIDGSKAVVLDEADILDQKGRNGLFSMIQKARIKALICMTLNRPDLAPKLEKAGIGKCYWVEGGFATLIN